MTHNKIEKPPMNFTGGFSFPIGLLFLNKSRTDV